MPEHQKDLYYVAVKLLLRNGSQLLITHDIFGSWDLPGGRIRVDEFDTPLTSVIERKMKEELGDAVTFSIGNPCVFFRVERMEQGKKVHIFAIGYDGKYEGGALELGDHHDQMKWVNVTTFKPEEYFTGGWLVGVQEYLAKL